MEKRHQHIQLKKIIASDWVIIEIIVRTVDIGDSFPWIVSSVLL
jgi:hypothetical protein